MTIALIGVGYLGSLIGEALNEPLLVTRSREKASDWMGQKKQVYILKPSLAVSWQALIDLADALIVTVSPTDVTSYEETYLLTAHHIAKALTKRARPFHLLYCSSTAVYGEKQGAPVDEETPLSPITPQVRVLAETEKVLLNLGSPHIRVSIVRIGELWGEGRRIENRLKKNPFLAGDGTQITNLTNAHDAARAFIFLLKNNFEGIFNVCSDLHIPRRQFYEELSSRYHFPLPHWDPSLTPSHSGGNKIVSSNKIKNLGFIFSYPGYT